ncbi:hypothetical protein HK103_001606 [Boothiomyces macroporosus]|uniref:Transcription factor domain-containing protein n=1 Tax=Boothiomyces macroporosus TaxID=261099 RepID=A0AAD5UAL4_9FUNG|nr:hypothetical protein HK103_001606 [Boothiomyces macroporosus]
MRLPNQDDSSNATHIGESSMVQEDHKEFDLEYEAIQNRILGLLHIYTRVSKSFLERSCNSLLMRYVVRAVYYTMQNDEPNRIIWIDKCLYEFRMQLPNPTLPNLMASVVLSLCYFWIGLYKVGLPYFSYVVRLAKEVGINRESGIALLTSDPQEREDCRNIWWLLYRIDQFLWSFNKGNISNEDNGIYLPGTSIYQNSQDDLRSLGMEMMHSSSTFVPHIPAQSVAVHKVLLYRLFGQAVHYSDKSREDQSIDTLFMLYNLKDSLYLWYSNLPEPFTMQYKLLGKDDPVDDLVTWQILDSYLQYHFAMIRIKSAIIFPNILEDYNAATQESIFPSLLLDCKEIARIMSFYILKNPALDKATIYFINYVYYATVPLILSRSAGSLELLEILLDHIKVLMRKFRVGNPICKLINGYLSLNDPALILERHAAYMFIDYLYDNSDQNDQHMMEYLDDTV